MTLRVESVLRRRIVETGRKLADRGLVVAAEGNLSTRLDAGLFLATPSGFSKAEMRESDLVVTDLEGRVVRGHRRPSSELAMHLAAYKARPDVEAVIHAHPPTATGFACAGIPLDEALLSEVVLVLGCVPLAPYATTGTPEMAASLSDFFAKNDAVLLANHGAVALGTSLKDAFWKLETVEQLAKVTLVTRLLGERKVLGEDQVQKLLLARKSYLGLDSVPERVPGCPKAG